MVVFSLLDVGDGLIDWRMHLQLTANLLPTPILMKELIFQRATSDSSNTEGNTTGPRCVEEDSIPPQERNSSKRLMLTTSDSPSSNEEDSIPLSKWDFPSGQATLTTSDLTSSNEEDSIPWVQQRSSK